MLNKLNKTLVSDLMQADYLTLSPDLSLSQALKLLCESGASHGMVKDQSRLIGVLSHQEILRGLWSAEFDSSNQAFVRDLMQTQLTTVSSCQPLAQLLETWVVDRQKLFPVNDMASLICSGYQSYEERLRMAASELPELLPVVEEDKLLGVLTRQQLGSWVATQMS